jgi:hypothetical protein
VFNFSRLHDLVTTTTLIVAPGTARVLEQVGRTVTTIEGTHVAVFPEADTAGTRTALADALLAWPEFLNGRTVPPLTAGFELSDLLRVWDDHPYPGNREAALQLLALGKALGAWELDENSGNTRALGYSSTRLRAEMEAC